MNENPDQLPSAPEWETYLLAALMQNPEAVWTAHARALQPALIHHIGRREIFQTLMDLHVSGRPLDELSVTAYLRAANQLDSVGGPSAISDLGIQIVTLSVVKQAIDELVNMRARRTLIATSRQMLGAAHDTTRPWQTIVEEMESALFELHTQTSRKGTRHVREILPEVVKELDDAWKNRGHVVSGLATGFTDLDRVLMGLKTGLFILAARPSRGKTVLAGQLAINLGMAAGHYTQFNQAKLPVVFYSLETTERSLLKRLFLNRWGVPISQSRQGTMSREQMAAAKTTDDELRESHIYLHESFGMTIQELRAQARLDVARHGARCIIVDYLQLLKSSSKQAQLSRQQEIADVSTGLKHLAHELGIPVIALAQLNREGATKRPNMSDLRESGQIEQDADYIAMICDAPEELTTSEDGLPSVDFFMGLDVVKNKDGPCTTDGPPIVFYWDKALFRLRSWSDSLLTNDFEKYQAGLAAKRLEAKQAKPQPFKAKPRRDIDDVFPNED
jgi:replicative DNA helicase